MLSRCLDRVTSGGRLGKGVLNIGCEARHGQLWVDEDDENGRVRAGKITRARKIVRWMEREGRESVRLVL
jgi:hypothetical protein